MNFEQISKHIDQIMKQQNNRSIAEFEGYSPFEMHQILHFTFEPESPLKLQKLSDSDYKKIPILNQIKYLMNLIDRSGELKLTKRGFLPTKVVSELYQKGFLKDEFIDKGYAKLYKETDSLSVHLTRILLELAGLTKKRHGKLSLTRSSKKILQNNFDLLRLILLTFATKFNWAYNDGYGENQIGQLGYGFSFILLSKYGEDKRLDSFYSKKYFKAFSRTFETSEPIYGTREEYNHSCYSIRTFDRFLDFFGLITIEKEGRGFDSIKYIAKTDLFDKLIKCMPHKSHL